ncbi:hypothetical protein LPJ77_004477 [Coemansia sp. RSA 2523]|nr:hypothetical protein LPJ77_004477 [Coemansia sp. RSA 2523]KAJ2200597.1 hypothetical protein IW144_000990 [Coemansia sp. RSA 522]KAJ2208030.1 hypothetical protein IW145_001036 [Coemansia sp. RSA 521]KAJ2275521.1 hypothetical protein J3F81_001773 [Coemansia sp. RSA 371]
MALWVEKHRPATLDKLTYHAGLTEHLQQLAKSGDIPHLLIYGPSGAGKRTRVAATLREIYGPSAEKLKVSQRIFETPSRRKLEINLISSNFHIEVNPSDAGIYDRVVIQDLIKEIAQTQQVTAGARKFKVVVVHEADALTRDAQHALRRTMEKYMGNMRVILCANSTGKIIGPVQSRCLLVRVAAPTVDEVADVINSVAKKEGISVPPAFALQLANASKRNLHRALLMLEAAYVQQYPFTDAQETVLPEWELYTRDIAAAVLCEQTPAQLLAVRKQLYEVLGHCIPPAVVLKVVAACLIDGVDEPLKPVVAHHAAFYEHRMQTGQKAIVHLEAFVAKFMSVYKRSLMQHGSLRFYSDAKYKTIKVPHMADSITEGTLKSWTKQVGEHVEQDEEVASIETDKVDIPVNSPVAGVLRELLANEEDTVVVGQDLFKIEEGAAAEGGAKPKATEAPAAAAIPKAEAKVEASKPEVTTPAASKPAAPAAPKPAASKPVSPPVSFGAPNRSERRVKMNRMRLRISERLKQSQDTAASLTTFNEIDMTNLIDMRKQYKDLVLKTHGVKLGYMGAFVKASSYALQAVPEVNASIDGDHMVYYDYCDVSVAVATPKGLVTPVLRNTERMGIVDVEQEIANLGTKARDNKITVEDMAGGTFTISNGGVFGSLYGTPIINMPQAAILGMHAIKDRPVVVNGEIKIRPMMYVALSYDHRIVDGREAVTFLVKLKEAIEDPRRLLLNV